MGEEVYEEGNGSHLNMEKFHYLKLLKNPSKKN